MRYRRLRERLPRGLVRHVWFFEGEIEDRVHLLAAGLAGRAFVLDAGAGEGRHRALFPRHRYVALDLAVGDAAWDYSKLDVLGDLGALPFRGDCFDAALNIVTLEHVREPKQVLAEIARVLKPGGRLLLIAPHEWEVHQAPHDYYRFTRHGLEYLLTEAGFAQIRVEPVGGFFRLLARRLLNALPFFPLLARPLAWLLFVPPALLLPWLDGFDRERHFTLGYACSAVKP